MLKQQQSSAGGAAAAGTTNNNNNKKKKYATRKISEGDVMETATVPAEPTTRGGGGDGDATAAEKKPLHTSMEQLQMQKQTMTTSPTSNASRHAAGSNWNAMRPQVTPTATTTTTPTVNNATALNETPPDAENDMPSPTTLTPVSKAAKARLRQKRKNAAHRNKYLSMDCEMVGVGFNGQDDMLARVSIVNKNGEVLLDKFVKPREAVTDYRTSVSGIRPRDIEHGEDFDQVQDQVIELLQGKILVGHAIRNDLAVLHIKHPFKNIRDTSRYKPLCRLVANGRTPSLKRLSQAILGLEIQTGEHNSVEDARATMNIYNRLSADWEKYIQKHSHSNNYQQ